MATAWSCPPGPGPTATDRRPQPATIEPVAPASGSAGLTPLTSGATTACEALPTSAQSSSGMWSIAPSLNEIKYRVNP